MALIPSPGTEIPRVGAAKPVCYDYRSLQARVYGPKQEKPLQ